MMNSTARNSTVGLVCQALGLAKCSKVACLSMYGGNSCSASSTSAAMIANHEPINSESVRVIDDSSSIGPSHIWKISHKLPPCASATTMEANADNTNGRWR